MASDKTQRNDDNKNRKKYTLFSAARLQDPSVKPLCAFFQSAAGCRNGSNCKFAHGHVNPVEAITSNQPNLTAAAAAPSKNLSSKNFVTTKSSAASISASSISSESSDSISRTRDVFVQENKNSKELPTNMGKKAGRKRKATEPHHAPAATNKGERNTSGGSPQKKVNKTNKSAVSNYSPFVDDKNPFDLGPIPDAIHNQTLDKQIVVTDEEQQHSSPDFRSLAAKLSMPITSPGTTITSSNTRNVKKEEEQKPQQEQQQPDYRSLISALPVAAFSMQTSQGKDASEEDDEDDDEDIDDGALEKENASNEGSIIVDEDILPTSHPDGRMWKDLVIKTRLHPRYVKVLAKQGEAWFKPKRYGPWCAKFPQVIAIDCEMCETKDPQTGKIDGKALCRISIVNALDPSDVLIDTLVKPEWPVTNYRSWINGIGKDHLENVKFTLSHAQEFMKALCSDETVILGHSLHNDLEAIKMEHHCVVDSSYLFPVKDADGKNHVCSLRDLAKQVLHKDMPSKHDSVNDARTALEAIQVYLAKNGQVDPIERKPKHGDAMKLLIHRIPKGVVSESHIENMFLHLTRIKPLSVELIQYSGGYGKTLVVFDTPDHANLSFRTLSGDIEVDKGNFLQKKVFLKNKDYVRVRKMMPSKRTFTTA